MTGEIKVCGEYIGLSTLYITMKVSSQNSAVNKRIKAILTNIDKTLKIGVTNIISW